MSNIDMNKIPSRIAVINPINGEREEGMLTEDGAYIGESVELGDHLHPSTFKARVMVLGKSSVRNWCFIDDGTIVNSARLFNARLGRNVIVNEGASIWGGDPFGAPKIGDSVIIGENTNIGPRSVIGAKTKVGADATLANVKIPAGSQIGDETVIHGR